MAISIIILPKSSCSNRNDCLLLLQAVEQKLVARLRVVAPAKSFCRIDPPNSPLFLFFRLSDEVPVPDADGFGGWHEVVVAEDGPGGEV